MADDEGHVGVPVVRPQPANASQWASRSGSWRMRSRMTGSSITSVPESSGNRQTDQSVSLVVRRSVRRGDGEHDRAGPAAVRAPAGQLEGGRFPLAFGSGGLLLGRLGLSGIWAPRRLGGR